MAFQCDGCDEEQSGARVVFTSEATDATGIDVVVTKRWTVCTACAEWVFEQIDEPSPWSDEDFKTVVQPGEEPEGAQLGGFAARL